MMGMGLHFKGEDLRRVCWPHSYVSVLPFALLSLHQSVKAEL